MQQKQICVVTYLNLDDSPESAIPGWQIGDSPYILNVHTQAPGTAGKAANVMGNTLIAYDLPAGNNKIIGCIEDEQNNTALVFFYNDQGSHQIARYFTTGMEQLMLTPLFNFSPENVIHSACIINDMIEWTDNRNEPRKINMAKALTAFKLEEHELFFSPKTPGTSRQLTITATRNGGIIIPLTVLIAFSSPSSERFCIDLANVLNTAYGSLFTFSAENKHVKAVSTAPGVCVITIAGVDVDSLGASIPVGFKDLVVNKYGPITDNYIATLIRPPFFTRPTATYVADDGRNTNQVDNNLFQLTTRPRMDDFEIPVLTAYSNVPIVPAGCVGGNFNTILLDFDDPKLQSNEWLACIRAVDILVRSTTEGADAFGPWKLIDTLFREDFVLNRTYNFYNDGNYSVVSQADQERAYDAIPLQVQTMETILANTDYRAVLANGVEGFDSPPVALEVTPTFADANPVTSATGYVTFDIYQFCPFSPYAGAYKFSKKFQPIHSPDGGTTFAYGGMGIETIGSGIDPKEGNVTSSFLQQLAEPGWTAFAQGIETYATSVQNNPTIPVSGGTINVDIVSGIGSAGNVWNSDKYGNALSEINYTGRQAIREAMKNGLVKSTVTIALPVGTRIVSIAHPWVSSGDKLNKGDKFDRDKGLEWQKQGCPIMMFDGVLGASQATVEVTAGATITLGDCYIFDWTNPYHFVTSQRTKVVYGRLVDKNGLADSPTNLIQTGTLLERQMAVITLGNGIIGSNLVEVPSPPSYTSTLFDGTTSDFLDTVLHGLCPTDFNGFFSFATFQDRKVYAAAYGVLGDGSTSPNIINIAASSDTFLDATGPKWFEFGDQYYKGLLDGSIASGTGDLTLSIGDAQNYIFYNNDKGGVNNMASCSTSIIGRVVSGTTGVPDILVQFENTGRNALTSSTGLFEIQVLGDSVENLNRRGLTRMPAGTILFGFRDRLVFNGTQLCEVTWPFTNTRLAEITPFWIGQDYSEGHPFEIEDVEAFVNIFAVRNIVQRGGTYHFVVNLIDEGGRRATSSIPLTIRIPEITENLKTFDPFTYLVDTYRLGVTSLSWSLPSAIVPKPEVGYFKYYQLGISQDTAQLMTFTWAANDIVYVASFDATTLVTADKAAAKELYIGVDNIFLYADQYTDSRISYTAAPGDIITLICKPDGTPLVRPEGPYEAKVTGQRESGGFLYITVENLADWPIIEPGTVFKIKRLRAQVTEEITFGIGPVMEILNPQSDSPTFSVLSGTINDADTYLRKRQIPYRPVGKPPGSLTLTIEDKAMSDFFPSTEWGHGVANFFRPDEKQRRYETRLRTSGAYLPASNTNGLSTYEPLAFQDHSYVWGAIMRLIIAGESLKCIGKNGIISRYPGKPVLNQSLTGAITVSGENVLGGYHEDNSGFGTRHPESVIAIGNIVYGFDAYRGLVWRGGYNATVPISNYKASKYFRQKGRDYLGLPLPIWGTYDRATDEYILAFPASETDPSGRGSLVAETISFLEAGALDSGFKNRWQGFWSYHPECMGRLGTTVLTAFAGRLYTHKTNPIRGEFYGVKYPAIAVYAAVEDNQRRKDWLAVEMKSRPLWIYPEITNPEGQLSKLDAVDFEETERDFYAAFWFDLNTPDVTNPISRGDDLRGNILLIQAYNNDDTEALLTSISVKYTLSEPTQK